MYRLDHVHANSIKVNQRISCVKRNDERRRKSAGARYTKSIASLELRHKEHNNDPYSLHNNTIDFT